MHERAFLRLCRAAARGAHEDDDDGDDNVADHGGRLRGASTSYALNSACAPGPPCYLRATLSCGISSQSGSGCANEASASAPEIGRKPGQSHERRVSDWKSPRGRRHPAGTPRTKTCVWSPRGCPHSSQSGEFAQASQTAIGVSDPFHDAPQNLHVLIESLIGRGRCEG